jgi:hypothetical protein
MPKLAFDAAKGENFKARRKTRRSAAKAKSTVAMTDINIAITRGKIGKGKWARAALEARPPVKVNTSIAPNVKNSPWLKFTIREEL